MLFQDSYYYDDYASEDEMEDYSTKPVPIWLSICLVIGYIVGGAFLFQVRNNKFYYGLVLICFYRNGKDGLCWTVPTFVSSP